MSLEPEHERRALRVLGEVLDVPPSELPTRLAELCGGDARLRRRVEDLLGHAAAGAPPLADGGEWLGDLLPDEPPRISGKIGSYEILEPLGQGGMSEVYRARQAEPARDVAIKILRHGLLDANARRRFQNEAHLLAHLRHPNIAEVFDAGVHTECTSTGVRELPYLVLECVGGARTIVDYAEQESLSLRARLRLLADVARAVHHGHQNGVIHRDLKPANVLVGRDGRAKVIDFGVARVVQGDLTPQTVMTLAGQVVGTLGYIPPELLAGEVEVADVRADVYALGAMAYQLVLGTLPFAVDGLSIAEAARRVTTTVPIRPRARRPSLDPDLEGVLWQAVARDPADRYATADAFAEDLERWLRHEAVAARRPGLLRRLRLFVRRDPSLAGAMAAIAALLLLGALTIAVLQALARADSEAKAREVTAAKELAEFRLSVASVATAQVALQRGDLALAQHHLTAVPTAHRQLEWHILHHAANQHVREFALDTEREDRLVRDFRAFVAIHPDGEHLYTAAGTRLRRIEIDTGRVVARHRSDAAFRLPIAIAGDGGRLVADSFPATNLWSAHPITPLPRFTSLKPKCIAISPDSTRVVQATYRGWLHSGSADGSHVRDVFVPAGVDALVWPGRANACYMLSGESLLRFDPSSLALAEVCSLGAPARPLLAASADGSTLATVVRGVIQGIDTASGAGTFSLPVVDSVRALALCPDARLLAAGFENGGILIQGLPPDEGPRIIAGHSRPVTDLVFHPAGGLLVSAGADDVARVWDPYRPPPATAVDRHLGFLERGPGHCVHGEAAGRIVSRGEDAVVRVFAADDLSPLSAVLDAGDVGPLLAFEPGTGLLLTAGPGLEVQARETLDLSVVRTVAAPFRPQQLVFAPGGRTCVIARGARLQRLDWRETRAGWSIRPRPDHRVRAIRWSADGTRIAISCGTEVLLVDAHDGSVMHLAEHPSVVRALCFLRGGELLAAAGDDGLVRVWQTARSELAYELRGHSSVVLSLDVAPDGDRLVSAAHDGAIKLWDTARMLEVYSFPSRSGWVEAWFGAGGRCVLGRTKSGALLRHGTGDERSDSRRQRWRASSEVVRAAEELLAECGGDVRGALDKLGDAGESDARLTMHLRLLRGEERHVLRDAWDVALDPEVTAARARAVVLRMTGLGREVAGRAEIWLLRAFANYRNGSDGRVAAALSTLQARNVSTDVPRLEQARLAVLALAANKAGHTEMAQSAFLELERHVRTHDLAVPRSLVDEVRAAMK